MKRQSSGKSFAILSAASVICKVLAFVYLPIQALLVHDSGNGVISAGFKLYAFIYAMTNAGLPVVISKFVSERDELGDYRGIQTTFRTAFTMMMTMGIISTLFMFFASGFLADWCGMPEAKLMFMGIAPTFLFSSLSCAMRGYFQGRRNMTPTAISQIIEQIINSLCTVLFEVLFFRYAQSVGEDTITYTAIGSAAATVTAAAGSAAFLAVMYFVVFRRQRRVEQSKQTYHGPGVTYSDVFRRMLTFSIPAIIGCIATSAGDIIDTKSCIPLLMRNHLTSDEAYALFGIYSTKYQRLLTLPCLFAAPLVASMIPSLSAALSRRDSKYFRHKIREGYQLNYIVVMPIAMGLTFLAQPILTLIFTTQNAGAPVVISGIWMTLLISAYSIQSGVLISLNRPFVAPAALLLSMAAKIACNYILIPIASINIYGAVIGNALSWLITVLVNQHVIDRILRKRQGAWRYAILPGISSLVMGALCAGVFAALDFVLGLTPLHAVAASDLALLVTIPFGAVVYFKMMIRLGGITVGDLKKIPMGNKCIALMRKIPFLRSDLKETSS
ncbi:MAG: polysaccharide biosynthesis protein [Oscillospiraceae bacterium]|nr:polysaccharide biosynthesis protein [Oscillospiraceae bacterium]